jgi:hypothetical protein
MSSSSSLATSSTTNSTSKASKRPLEELGAEEQGNEKKGKSTIVVSTEDAKDAFTCAICRQIFGASPVTMSCGHVFDEHCTNLHRFYEEAKSQEHKCPLCRAPVNVLVRPSLATKQAMDLLKLARPEPSDSQKVADFRASPYARVEIHVNTGGPTLTTTMRDKAKDAKTGKWPIANKWAFGEWVQPTAPDYIVISFSFAVDYTAKNFVMDLDTIRDEKKVKITWAHLAPEDGSKFINEWSYAFPDNQQPWCRLLAPAFPVLPFHLQNTSTSSTTIFPIFAILERL